MLHIFIYIYTCLNLSVLGLPHWKVKATLVSLTAEAGSACCFRALLQAE